MNPLNCMAVQEQIELYAAGECDAPLADDIAAHLAHCAHCTRAYEQARELVGTLDLRFRERDGLQRVLDGVRREEKKRRVQPVILVFLRRAAAVAALFLVVVGVLTLLGSLRLPQPQEESQVASAAGARIEVVWQTPDFRFTPLGPGRVKVESGQARLKVSPTADGKKGDVEIVTPAGVARARDSEFVIEVQSPRQERAAPEAAVTVLRGRVSFATAKGRGVISSGETMSASKNAPPAPQAMPKAAFERLLAAPDAAPRLLPKAN